MPFTEWSFWLGGHCHAIILSIFKINPFFTISTGIIFNLVTLPVIFRVYVKNLKRLGTEGQQNSLWLLLTTLAISDTLEIIIYLSSYSLLHRSPDSDYVVGFYIPNQPWYELRRLEGQFLMVTMGYGLPIEKKSSIKLWEQSHFLPNFSLIYLLKWQNQLGNFE